MIESHGATGVGRAVNDLLHQPKRVGRIARRGMCHGSKRYCNEGRRWYAGEDDATENVEVEGEAIKRSKQLLYNETCKDQCEGSPPERLPLHTAKGSGDK